MDAANPAAFPIRLDFNTQAATFAMKPLVSATQHLLTTQVSPVGGGTISPASGLVNQGPVNIGAAANSGFAFLNFSGALTGSTNPQSLNLTGPSTVTANFNRPPVGGPQTEYAIPSTAKTFLLNVSDPDNEALTFLVPTPPTKGTLSINAGTRQATYTPNAGALGSDSFVYRATDINGLQSPQLTVRIQMLTNTDASLQIVSQSAATEAPPCAPGKIYRLNQTWRNIGAVAVSNVTAKVLQLTGGNTLADFSVGQTADSVIDVNEQFPSQFRIQLAACAAFTFRVSMFGLPVGNLKTTSRAAGTNSPVYLGESVFTADPAAEVERADREPR